MWKALEIEVRRENRDIGRSVSKFHHNDGSKGVRTERRSDAYFRDVAKPKKSQLFRAYLGKEIMYSDNRFSQLEFLILSDLEKLERWHLGTNAMPLIKGLGIHDCPNLKEILREWKTWMCWRGIIHNRRGISAKHLKTLVINFRAVNEWGFNVWVSIIGLNIIVFGKHDLWSFNWLVYSMFSCLYPHLFWTCAWYASFVKILYKVWVISNDIVMSITTFQQKNIWFEIYEQSINLITSLSFVKWLNIPWTCKIWTRKSGLVIKGMIYFF